MVEGVALGTFGPELRRRRAAANLSLADLAMRLHYSKGYLSKVENGAKLPSRDLATRCDALLRASGELLALLPAATATPATASASDLAEPPDPPGPVVDVGGPLGGVPSGWAAAARDPATVAAFAGLLGQLRALGRSWPPALLLPTVVAQTRTLVYVARAAPPAPFGRLFLVAGRFAEYAGWMYQEAGDDREMARWTRLAVRYGQMAGDAALATYADVRLAGAAMYQGDAASTVALARRAAARAGTTSRVRGLALQRQAQGHAMLGEGAACF
jgi:transcriptional regulator with XRE-family HTH domain